MSQSILRPRRPINLRGWRLIPDRLPQLEALGYPFERWVHDANGILVISALEVAVDPGAPALGPEYHISVSAMGQRCSAADALWALAQFDLTDAKEDNHVPSGVCRNFWRPVADRLSGAECPCVETEPTIREDKGDFVWRGRNSPAA